jgi:hypothetical protein
MAASVRFLTRFGAEVLVPVDAPSAADLDRAVLELQRELGRLRWRACSPPPGGHLFPLTNEPDFDWALLGAERGKGAGDRADEEGVWAHDGFYTRRELEANSRKNLKPAIKYSRGARPTDPPEVVEGDGDYRYVTLCIFRGGGRREELAVPKGGTGQGRGSEAERAVARAEPAGADPGGERSTAELTPEDYITTVVDAALRLRDKIPAYVGVEGVGDVKDIRAWVVENHSLLRDPKVYRVVSRVVADLVRNARNRRKADQVAGEAASPREQPAAQRGSPEEEQRAARITYVETVGPRAGDAAQIIVGNRSRSLKRYVREEWSAIKADPAKLLNVVEAIERTTRIPFAALTGDAGGEPGPQQTRTASGGRR